MLTERFDQGLPVNFFVIVPLFLYRYANGRFLKDQGSVVQSIVSLTSSLRDQLVKCFTTL